MKEKETKLGDEEEDELLLQFLLVVFFFTLYSLVLLLLVYHKLTMQLSCNIAVDSYCCCLLAHLL